jgi:hypothetical protein
MAIDSYRFLDFATRQIMKAWAARQEPGVIPFTPLAKPLGVHRRARLDRRRGAQRRSAV